MQLPVIALLRVVSSIVEPQGAKNASQSISNFEILFYALCIAMLKSFLRLRKFTQPKPLVFRCLHGWQRVVL